MATWTDPDYWGFLPRTAAWLNQQIRDNFKALGDPWTTYTPSWTAVFSNPVLGNGSLTGAYTQTGKRVMFWARITIGSTTTFGSGPWLLSPPVPPANSPWGWTWMGRAWDASGTASYLVQATSFYGGLLVDSTTAGGPARSVNGSVPFTWAAGDQLDISGFYEAA